MKNSRQGRPGGRPKKEYSEYVPKGIDPSDDARRHGDHQSYQGQDRPTEGKFDSYRQNNKRQRGGYDYGKDGRDHHYYDHQSYAPKDHHSSKYYDQKGGDYVVKNLHINDEHHEDQSEDSRPREYARQHRGRQEEKGMLPYHKREKKRPEDKQTDSGEESRPKVAYQWRECVVCLLKCTPTSAVWNCQSCRITCHLKCIKDWIFKQNNIDNQLPNKADKTKVYAWSCPHCKADMKEPLPAYLCFCGKVKNPKADTYLEPHSCGQKCDRKRGGNCSHPCPTNCHSGPCPPCEVVLPEVTCFCGRENRERVCGDLGKRSCGELCGKKLSCHQHQCEKICHEGDCPPCPKKQVTSCYCGKKEEERSCGEEFSCAAVCNRLLNCEVHRCPKVCHEGTCEDCPLYPIEKEKCFCGRKLQEQLLGHPRDGCYEERKACGQKCKKVLVCGHSCIKDCHDGECECGNQIDKRCRCDNKSTKVPCHRYLEEYLCDKVCKAKKSCKVHRCEIKCCISPPNSLEHTCFEYCGKKMDCGIHFCSRRCHTGKCGECNIKINQSLRCACGDRVIPAPIKCGTEKPVCLKKCGKLLPCGHACYFNCHEGDCKPCQEIVDKPCACGKKIIERSICSMKMFCHNVCEMKLPCGHSCGNSCHSEDCLELLQKKKAELEQTGVKVDPAGCANICGRKRRGCGHPCNSLCHPTLGTNCPQDPCRYQVKIKCKCGNRSTFVECGCTDKKLVKELPCDDKCMNLQRFKVLYEKTAKKIYYPGFLVKFARSNFDYLVKLERKFAEMLLGSQNSYTISFDKNSGDKQRALQVLTSRHYLFEVISYKSLRSSSLIVTKTAESLIPKMPLFEYFNKISNGDIDVDQEPFDAVIRFYNLSYYENATELEKILVDYRDEFYIETDKTGRIKLYVWEKDSVSTLTKKLQKSGTGFSLFEVEEYSKKDEEESLQEEVIIKHEAEGESDAREAPALLDPLADDRAEPLQTAGLDADPPADAEDADPNFETAGLPQASNVAAEHVQEEPRVEAPSDPVENNRE